MHRLQKRRLANALGTIVSKIAEDRAGEPTIGDDEWNVDELLYRTITRRSINSCKQSRERERIILILDTSPSCAEESRFYMDIAKSSVNLNDLEMYDAPNGHIVKEYNALDRKFIPIGKDKSTIFSKWEMFVNRTIIFFGDYDGRRIINEASKHNNIYWFNPVYTEHDYYHEDFVGNHIYKCKNEKDFMRLVRKIR